MTSGVIKHQKYLTMLLESTSPPLSPQGRPVVQALLRLLHQAEQGEPLKQGDFNYARNKVTKVTCFTERYGGAFDFLEGYQTARRDMAFKERQLRKPHSKKT